jgi:hypothetical protein
VRDMLGTCEGHVRRSRGDSAGLCGDVSFRDVNGKKTHSQHWRKEEGGMRG